jgi:hypothetical protein
MSAPAADRSDREQRLDEVLGLYLEAQAAGRTPPMAEFLAAHPDLAPELGAFLAEHERFHGLTAPLRLPATVGADLPGQERFVLVRPLGAGATGTVYQARDQLRQTQVALKVLRLCSPQALQRFKQEFRRLADISHPNLVVLHELLSAGPQWFFTMDLVEGTHFLEHLAPEGGPVRDYDRLRTALRQLAEGVAALHAAGILHRDLKPSNVLVSDAGRVVLLDFGLATDLERGTPATAYAAGTAAYMAPEQAVGATVTPASDWYSVGVILYAALTGQLPFLGRPPELLHAKQHREPPAPRARVPEVPEDLNSLCAALLRRHPAERPTGADVLRRLGHPARPPRGPLLPRPLFVGREDELAQLSAAFAEIQQGRGVTLLLHGPSGVGKSTLLQRFLDELRQRGAALVLPGRCYEREAIPYKALDSLIDALAQHLRQLPEDERAALLPPDLALLVRIFPVLRQSPAPPEDEPPGTDLTELRWRAFRALRELLTRLARRQPLVLAVDDLQWGDVDSGALLAEILAAPEPPPLLFLGCYRGEDRAGNPFLGRLVPTQGTWGGPEAVRELAVGPLAPPEARRLAADLLGPAGAAQAETIATEAGGIPFFIREIARHQQQIGSGSRRLQLTEVVWDRVAHLPAETRTLLEVVALASGPVRQQDA